MDAAAKVEAELSLAFDCIDTEASPPTLVRAMRHAVFPAGARVRPRMCLAVAAACGDDVPAVSAAAAAAIELLHCASLVHDDLPCFDDAHVRRGRPSVHRAYGEPLALLAGDGLIMLAFETLGRSGEIAPSRLALLLPIVSRAVGAASGAVAGQAWECEPRQRLSSYHQAKTGALFAAASMAGAAAAGHEPLPWRDFGERLGEAYQVADDIRDVALESAELGKPSGRDAALGRPSAAAELGMPGALARLDRLIGEATATIPACPGAATIRGLIAAEVTRLIPRRLARFAA